MKSVNIPFDFPENYEISSHDISFLIGSTGSGKSYAGKQIVRKMDRVIIWDSGKEYFIKGLDDRRFVTKTAEKNFDGTRILNCKLAVSPNDLRMKMRKAVRKGEYGKKYRIVIRPDDVSDVEEFERYNTVIEYHMSRYGLGWFYVVEEISDVTRPNYTPPRFKSMIRRHRHYEMGMAIITQRPSGTSTWVKSQARHVFIFNLGLVNDLKAVDEYIGQIKDSEGKKVNRMPISPALLKVRNFILYNLRSPMELYVIDDIKRLIQQRPTVAKQNLPDPQARESKWRVWYDKAVDFFIDDDLE